MTDEATAQGDSASGSRKRRSVGLADIPADGDTGDMGLGLEAAADALAEFISYCATPLTIGLQGDWGSGKTSLMNFVETRMDDAMTRARAGKKVERGKHQSIWFNTWTYSQFNQEDRLCLSLMTNLPRELQLKIQRENSAKSESFNKCLRIFGKGVRAAINVATAVASGGAVKVQEVTSLFAENEDPDQARLLGDLRDGFEKLVDAFLEASSSDRLIIYVDDLDRLKPSRAVEVLEVIKNFLDVPRCVFVLAIDYDVVVEGLRERKGQEPSRADGKSFFDKIIQVPFRMPVTLYDTSAFVRRQLEDHTFGLGGGKMSEFWLSEDAGQERLERLIRHSVGANPRSIKRLINLFTLQTILTKKQSEGGKGMGRAEARRMLLPITCLQMTSHAAYQFILDSGQNVDVALVALSIIGRLAAREDAHEDWDSAIDELREEWGDAAIEQWPLLNEWVERAHALAVRLRNEQELKDKNFRDIEEISKLTFQAIDLNSDGKLGRDELAYLEQLFRVADMVSDSADGGDATTLRSTATFDELRKRAYDGGVGEMYDVLMRGLRQVFDVRSTTKRAVRWQGIVEGRRRKLALMETRPEGPATDFIISVEMFSEYFGVFAGEVAETMARSFDVVAESRADSVRIRLSTTDQASLFVTFMTQLKREALQNTSPQFVPGAAPEQMPSAFPPSPGAQPAAPSVISASVPTPSDGAREPTR